MTAEWWERSRAAETARARELLRGLVEELRRRGVAPGPLRARAGSARYRTDVVGWYLRADGSLGVGERGEYYVLDVAPSVRARGGGLADHRRQRCLASPLIPSVARA